MSRAEQLRPAAATSTRMPAEWEPHARTWMAFPTANETFGPEDSPDLARARTAWSSTANVVAAAEPTTMIAAPQDVAVARTLLDSRVTVVELPLDDAWLRDTGPTFVTMDAREGQSVQGRRPSGAAGAPRRPAVGAVDWIFNGWGAQDWAFWERDAHLARRVAELAETAVVASPLVQEGGGFHVDGDGTVLLTDTVQLDPLRNAGWTRSDVEAEVHARLGTSAAIWLPRGLTADYGRFGTRGHVDIVATFTRPGTVLVHAQNDPGHPDHAVSQEVMEVLRTATDARGRRLEVLELPAPLTSEVDGELVDHSYINHYLANGIVVVCAFDDAHDDLAASVLAAAHPGRRVVAVDARDVFAFGGGVHCITQQQPL